MTYYEIMKMVAEAVSDTFLSLVKAEDKQAIIEATTQIYVTQMQNETRASKYENTDEANSEDINCRNNCEDEKLFEQYAQRVAECREQENKE